MTGVDFPARPIAQNAYRGSDQVAMLLSFTQDWLSPPLDSPNAQTGYAHIPQGLRD